MIFESVRRRANKTHNALGTLQRLNAGRQCHTQQTLRPRELTEDALVDAGGGYYFAVFDAAPEAGSRTIGDEVRGVEILLPVRIEVSLVDDTGSLLQVTCPS